MVGGNTILNLQRLSAEAEYDQNGKRIEKYDSIAPILGWLDLIDGDSKYNYKAKVEDSTHVFICDYTVLGKIDIEKTRAVVEDITTCAEMKTEICENLKKFSCKDFCGKAEVYDVKYIDDPMDLHQHLEIYLKKVGGQNEY